MFFFRDMESGFKCISDIKMRIAKAIFNFCGLFEKTYDREKIDPEVKEAAEIIEKDSEPGETAETIEKDSEPGETAETIEKDSEPGKALETIEKDSESGETAETIEKAEKSCVGKYSEKSGSPGSGTVKRYRVKSKGKVMKKQEECNYLKNRELSWLQFNERVLNEAWNPRVPLAERLSFISIYQSNLDEFFMVRVGSLMTDKNSGKKERENKTNMTASMQLKAILKRVRELEKKKKEVYEQLMGELEPAGIRILNFNRLSQKEGELLEAYFDSHIAPYVFPLVTQNKTLPFLNNKELYAIVSLEDGKKKKLGIVPCENKVFKRLIEIETRPGTFMLSEELLLHFVWKLFPGMKVNGKSLLRITRNADIDASQMYDEDLDYRETMEKLLKQRKRLGPVRIELSRDIQEGIKESLIDYFGLDKSHIIKNQTPLDLKFVSELQARLQGRQELFYERRSPRNTCLDLKKKLIPQIEKKDVLLSYPFESMKPFIQLLNEASEDDEVISIRMTLYRLADPSQIVDALIEASENGKEVVVLLELRARFDEANNIGMSRRLEDAGCHVIYGLEDFKVHSKLCLITRKCGEEIKFITQVGTGNYNEKTARLYTDLSLITSDTDIGLDARDIFDALLRNEPLKKTRALLQAPLCLRDPILKMMDEEIVKSSRGEEAYIGIKINSLTDKVLIEKLREASEAGVKVELIVRGICCLIPGIEGITDNIRVVSVVGRYLEHSRIYRFGRKDADRIYISSADFMTRNTIRRVEVACPVNDPDLKEKIRHIFDTIMLDDEKGKEMGPDGCYHDRYINEEKLNSQELFYKEAYDSVK